MLLKMYYTFLIMRLGWTEDIVSMLLVVVFILI